MVVSITLYADRALALRAANNAMVADCRQCRAWGCGISTKLGD
jgi:hypothetical protein